jgi:hypothetical protein
VTLEELADIEAIRRLTHDYGFAFDTRDYDGYPRWGGRGSMHQQLNHRIEVDGDRATGTVYFVALGQLKAGNRYEWDGYYKDEYVRTPEGWKFASRILYPLMPIDGENLDYSNIEP